MFLFYLLQYRIVFSVLSQKYFGHQNKSHNFPYFCATYHRHQYCFSSYTVYTEKRRAHKT